MSGIALFLAHAADPGAEATIVSVARSLGPDRVLVVRPEALPFATWRHAVNSVGRASTSLRLAGAQDVAEDSLGVVVNFMRGVPRTRLARAARKDQEYAGAEMQSLLASWLMGLGDRVLNPTNVRAFTVGPGSTRGWLLFSAGHGLPVSSNASGTPGRLLRPPGAREVVTTREPWPAGAAGPMPATLTANGDGLSTVFVAGDQAVGRLACLLGERCIAATRASEARALAFHFVNADDCPQLVEVDSLPMVTNPEQAAALGVVVVSLANGLEVRP